MLHSDTEHELQIELPVPAMRARHIMLQKTEHDDRPSLRVHNVSNIMAWKRRYIIRAACVPMDCLRTLVIVADAQSTFATKSLGPEPIELDVGLGNAVTC